MCYAPTEMAEPELKDTFYNQLQSTLDQISAGDTIILMGDMNAKVGEYTSGDGEVIGKHGLGTRNNNGTRFVDCCQRYGIQKGTKRSPDGVTVNQIDHIAISSRHRGHLIDVRSLRCADISLTDHYLVRGKIRVKLSKASHFKPLRLYDNSKLHNQEKERRI